MEEPCSRSTSAAACFVFVCFHLLLRPFPLLVGETGVFNHELRWVVSKMNTRHPKWLDGFRVNTSLNFCCHALRSPQGPGPFGMSPESRPAARPAPADTAKSGPGQVAQLAQKFGGQSASSEKEEKPKANKAHEAHEAHEAKGAGPVGPGLPHGPVNGASGASATSGATAATTSAAGTRLPQPMAPGQLAGRLPTLPLQRAGGRAWHATPVALLPAIRSRSLF